MAQGRSSLKLALIAVLALVPAFGFVPTAHACTGPTPTVDTGVLYVVANTNQGSPWIVQLNQVALGIDICWWQGPGTRVYQETNGSPGLQAHASSGCEADQEVLVAFVARGGQCSI